MAQNIFRKESVDQMASPEQLNDYIKVSSGGVWVILSAIAVLLISAFVWAIFGNLTTTVNVAGIANDGTVVCYVNDASQMKPGSEVILSNGAEGTIKKISSTPVKKEEIASGYDEYINYYLNLSEWNYPVFVDCPNATDGIVTAKIVIQTTHPISFLWH